MILDFAEAAGRAVIDRENSFCDEYAIDDNEHIPRLRRVVEAISSAALDAGENEGAVAELRRRLLEYAEDEYLRRWMEILEEDEDPDEAREEGVSMFRHVLAGDEDLNSAYAEMATDEVREADAEDWSDSLIRDVSDETR